MSPLSAFLGVLAVGSWVLLAVAWECSETFRKMSFLKARVTALWFQKNSKVSSLLTPCAQDENISLASLPLYMTDSPLPHSFHLLWVVKAAGLSFYALAEEPVIMQTGRLPKRSLFIYFFTAIYTTAALLEWTMRCRWVLYPFVTTAFQKVKHTSYCMEYMKVQ